jgi:hypothetical protein
MKRSTLTLKAVPNTGQPSANAPPTVVAGKPKPPSALMLKRLQCYADQRHRVFIQMRNGAGYCGRIDAFESGWLSMRDTTIHGTKNNTTVPELIVQILDGRQIAHIHAADSTDIGVTK